MDWLSHAVAGAAVGYAFGDPTLGAVVALVPDLPLLGPRRALPPRLYDWTHSLLFTFAVGGAALVLTGSPLVLWALVSHLVLDLPTHGRAWGAPVLLPFSNARFALWNNDWELFSPHWWAGLAVTITWSLLWLI